MEYSKLDETTLSVSKPVESTEETNEYKLDFLKEQEVSILKQKNDYIEARDKELLEVQTLIAKCEELGIQSELEAEEARNIKLEPIT